METIESIYHRRAVRHYTPEAVQPAVLMQLLDAAVQAPSPLNSQPWSFAVFCGRARLAGFSTRIKEHLLLTLPSTCDLHEHVDWMNRPEYDAFHGAPALVLICAKPQGYSREESCALAAQNLMLAAHASGLGTCPVGFVRSWFRLPHIKDELDIPGTHLPMFPLVVGHPDGRPAPPNHKRPEILVWADGASG